MVGHSDAQKRLTSLASLIRGSRWNPPPLSHDWHSERSDRSEHPPQPCGPRITTDYIGRVVTASRDKELRKEVVAALPAHGRHAPEPQAAPAANVTEHGFVCRHRGHAPRQYKRRKHLLTWGFMMLSVASCQSGCRTRRL